MKKNNTISHIFVGIFFLATLTISAQNTRGTKNYSEFDFDFEYMENENEWDLDEYGRIVNRFVNSECDSFFIVDEDGNRIDGKSISFEYGTIKQQVSQDYHYSDNGKIVRATYDYYKIDSDENASELFQFLADNTNVEWSQMQFIDNNYIENNYISTSHHTSAEYSSSNLLSQPNMARLHLITHIHNHPGGDDDGYPSGLPGDGNAGAGDIRFAQLGALREVQKRKRNSKYDIHLPEYYIYKSAPNNTHGALIRYDHKSTRSDFN